MFSTYRVEILLGLSLLLSFFSWGKKILFPFQLFTTWVHECWHALVAALLGGSDIQITIEPDGSGLTYYRVEKGRVREALIASAGYLGASATGCALFYLTATPHRATSLLATDTLVLGLAGLILLSVVFWIRNGFGVFVTLTLAAAIGSLHYAPMNRYASPILLFLAIQTALNALFDIRTLFGLRKKTKSDAHTLQRLFFMPYWFWAMLWLAMSLAMIALTIQTKNAKIEHRSAQASRFSTD